MRTPKAVLFLFLSITLVGSNRVFAQGTDEVVAPVRIRTLIRVSAPANSMLSVQKGSFQGSAELISDRPHSLYTLVVIPDQQDGPSDLTISNQGATLRTVRVFPVVAEAEERTIESGAPLPTPVPIAQPESAADASRLVAIPMVGGLHHRYIRVAA